MILVIFNALLYISALLIYFKKNHKFDCGFFLLAIYAFVALACVFEYKENPNQWNLTLFPFLYLFIVCVLFFRPYYTSSDLLLRKLKVDNLQTLKIFSIVYIVLAFITIISYSQ